MVHYHIRWSVTAEFDWDWHGSRGNAEESAELLVRRGKTYIIAGVDDNSCPCCPAPWRMANGDGTVTASSLNYPWQETVAVAEIRPDFRPMKSPCRPTCDCQEVI